MNTQNGMHFLKLLLLSLIMTSMVTLDAYRRKKEFYGSIVYLTNSSISVCVLYIQSLILIYVFGVGICRLFFGRLRQIELDTLIEKSWYALSETCLAFTIFREDLSPKFLAFFTLLLFLKGFHWLGEERVDFMERTPVISSLFHTRIFSLIVILGAIDVAFFLSAYEWTLKSGPSAQMIFGFEYAILFVTAIDVLIKYLSNVHEIYEPNYENKMIFTLYSNLVINIIKLSIYVAFITTMVRIYTLPLFAMRPLFLTSRSFIHSARDIVLSRRALKNLSKLYPDATLQEMQHEEVCVICREDLLGNAKKLPCSHIFHKSCLRSWFQRQQTCPTCRLNILDSQSVTSRTSHSENMSGRNASSNRRRVRQHRRGRNSRSNSSSTSLNEQMNILRNMAIEGSKNQLKFLQDSIQLTEVSLVMLARCYSAVEDHLTQITTNRTSNQSTQTE